MRANIDAEFTEDRIPLHIDGMDVGTASVVGRSIVATLRSDKIHDALSSGKMRVTRVMLQVERVEPDAESG